MKINHLFFCILYGLLSISISMILTSTNKLGKELDVSNAQSFPFVNFLKINQNLISSSSKSKIRNNSRISKKDECKVDGKKVFLPPIVNYPLHVVHPPLPLKLFSFLLDLFYFSNFWLFESNGLPCIFFLLVFLFFWNARYIGLIRNWISSHFSYSSSWTLQISNGLALVHRTLALPILFNGRSKSSLWTSELELSTSSNIKSSPLWTFLNLLGWKGFFETISTSFVLMQKNFYYFNFKNHALDF